MAANAIFKARIFIKQKGPHYGSKKLLLPDLLDFPIFSRLSARSQSDTCIFSQTIYFSSGYLIPSKRENESSISRAQCITQ